MQDHVLNRLIGEVDLSRFHQKSIRSPKNQPNTHHVSPLRMISPERLPNRLDFAKKQQLEGPPCRRCIVRNIISKQSQKERSNSKLSRIVRDIDIKKSRSKSSNRRDTMTSLEMLKNTNQLIKNYRSNNFQKSKSPHHSDSKNKNNHTISMMLEHPSASTHKEERKKLKVDKAKQTQKRCSELIRKKLELQQRQRQRLKAVIKIQSFWRGYLQRKKIQQEYQKMLEEEEQFEQNRKSFINDIKESRRSDKKENKPKGDNTDQMEKELEDILQLKEELKRQMDQIGQLRDRLERKDKEREQYYINYIRQLEQKYRNKDSTNKNTSVSDTVKIEDQSENEQEQQIRKDRVKGKVKRMLEIILAQRIQKQLAEEPQEIKEGIQTNISYIKQYMTRIVQHIAKYYNRQCQLNVNRSFGFSYERRLALLHEDLEEDTVNSYSGEILHFVVPESIFEELESLMYISQDGRHFRKAIFDALNQGLTTLRPYYKQSSQPYPWSMMNFQHRQLTFQEAVVKVCGGIINSATVLCGLIISLQPVVQNQLALQNREWKIDVFEKRQQKATMVILQHWIADSPDWQYREDEKTEIGMEISDWLLEELVGDLIRWITRISCLRDVMF